MDEYTTLKKPNETAEKSTSPRNTRKEVENAHLAYNDRTYRKEIQDSFKGKEKALIGAINF